MSAYDDDRWEFAPEDEGSIAPDATDSRAVDDGSYERVDDSLETDHVGYPDAPESVLLNSFSDPREGEKTTAETARLVVIGSVLF